MDTQGLFEGTITDKWMRLAGTTRGREARIGGDLLGKWRYPLTLPQQRRQRNGGGGAGAWLRQALEPDLREGTLIFSIYGKNYLLVTV